MLNFFAFRYFFITYNDTFLVGTFLRNVTDYQSDQFLAYHCGKVPSLVLVVRMRVSQAVGRGFESCAALKIFFHFQI